jgi:hypothetical protein
LKDGDSIATIGLRLRGVVLALAGLDFKARGSGLSSGAGRGFFWGVDGRFTNVGGFNTGRAFERVEFISWVFFSKNSLKKDADSSGL